MFARSFVCLIFVAGLVLAQEEALGPNGQPRPEPYSFSYAADSSEGTQATHQEAGDGTGRITGFYTIAGPDGRERRVEYVADADGYRAVVKTNEIGTRPTDSGDAKFLVGQPSEAQLAAANRVRPIEFAQAVAQPPRLAQAARPSSIESIGSDSPASQQQREQIPSANSPSASAARPDSSIGAEDQQQQTLANLDDIIDQPPQESPPRPVAIVQQPQLVQIAREQAQQIQLPNPAFQPIAPQQPQQIISQLPQQQQISGPLQLQVPIQRQDQAIFQGPQPLPIAIIDGPQQQQQLLELPAPSFNPRQPQGPIFVSQQPQGQAIQVQQKLSDDEGAGNQNQRGSQQTARPQTDLPQSIQEIKSQKTEQQQQQQITENPNAPIGPGSAGQRGLDQIQIGELGESKFGPKAPQQPQVAQIIEQPAPIEQPQPVNIQRQEQVQPIQPQQIVQLERIEPIQPQPIRLPEIQFRPQAPQQNVVQIVEQRQPAAITGVKSSVKTVAREQELQRIEPAPQPQFVPGVAPQQVEIIQPPQLIQGPIEPEIQIPNFAIERINPLSAPQPRPVVQAQQQFVEIPRQQQVIVEAPLPTAVQVPVQAPIQGIKFEPIFKQITVKGSGPSATEPEQPREQQQQQQQPAKGQVEIISLKEEPKQPEKSGESDQNNENDSQDNNNETSEQQSSSPAPAPAPAPTPEAAPAAVPAPSPRPIGRLVFGKTRFGAPTGTKFGTKTQLATQQERQAAAPQSAPAADQAPIPAPAQAPIIVAPVIAPTTQQPNQFIAFGTRLGTKSN